MNDQNIDQLIQANVELGSSNVDLRVHINDLRQNLRIANIATGLLTIVAAIQAILLATIYLAYFA